MKQKRLRKAFPFEVLSVKASDDGTEAEFEGYASVFGNKDLGGDIVERGAFTKTIQEQGGKVPLLADHDFTLKGRLGIGYVTEDDRGLRVKGAINLEAQAGREVYSHLKQAQQHGVQLGMSFGYAIPKGKSTFDRERQARLIHEVKLFEVTVTQFPMNEEAGATSVKATSFDEAFERYREQSQLSSEYWAIEDARWWAVDSALYDDEMAAAERLSALEESLSQYAAALTDWARRWFDYYDVKGAPGALGADLRTKHEHLREQIKALLGQEAGAAAPSGKAATSEGEGAAADAEPHADEQTPAAEALQLKALLASLQSMNQAVS